MSTRASRSRSTGRRATLLALLAALVLAVRPVPPGRAAAAGSGAWRIAGTWPAGGAGDARALRQPTGLAAGGGRVFVLDAAGPRLLAFDPALPDAEPLVLASGEPLRRPVGLALDAERDRVYLSDPGAGAVWIFDLAGRRLGVWAGLELPSGLAVDADGSVLVGLAGPGWIERFSPEGRRLGRWSVDPDSAGAPDGPASAFPGDRVRGLGLDSEGRVYAVVEGGRALRVFTRQGTLVDTVQAPPTAQGLSELALGRSDRDGGGSGGAPAPILWLASAQGLLRYDAAGGGWSLARAGSPSGLAVDGAGSLWAGESASLRAPGRLLELSGQGRLLRAWGPPTWPAGSLDRPVGLSTAADGTVLLRDAHPRAGRFHAEGGTLGQVELPMPGARDAIGGPGGRIYVTDGASLSAFDAEGRRLWWREVAGGGPATLSALALDGADRLLALDSGLGAVRRFGLDGRPIDALPLRTDAGGTGAPDPTRPAPGWVDLATDARGAVYALDRVGRRVLRLAPDGAGRPIPLAGPARRLAVGPDGSLVTLDLDGWLRHYESDGRLLGLTDAARFDLDVASRPADLARLPSGAILVADRGLDIVTEWRWDAGATAPAPPSPPGGDAASGACRPWPDKSAAPDRVAAGEPVGLRLSVRGVCGADPLAPPGELVLVLDATASMAGRRLGALQAAAESMLDHLDLGHWRVAVVWFNDTAAASSPLVADENQVRQALAGASAIGSGRIDLGLAAARDIFVGQTRPDARRALLLVADGPNAKGAEPLARELDWLSAQGIGVQALDLHGDPALAALLADRPGAYRRVPGDHALAEALADAAGAMGGGLFREIAVLDVLPDNMPLAAASAAPRPTIEADGRTLRWRLGTVPPLGFALRYALVPEAPGRWPTNVLAWGDFVDAAERAGRLGFPVPMIDVGDGVPPATATAPEPTRDPEPSPTLATTPSPTSLPSPSPAAPPTATRDPSPGATASPAPTETARPGPARVFLPRIERGALLIPPSPTPTAAPCPDAETEPNDRPVDALQRPALCPGRAIRGRLPADPGGGPGDADDYFRIELPGTGLLNAELSEIPAGGDLDLFLYDCNSRPGDCRMLARSQAGGARETLAISAGPGRLYLRVWRREGSPPSPDPYRLAWSWR